MNTDKLESDQALVASLEGAEKPKKVRASKSVLAALKALADATPKTYLIARGFHHNPDGSVTMTEIRSHAAKPPTEPTPKMDNTTYHTKDYVIGFDPKTGEPLTQTKVFYGRITGAAAQLPRPTVKKNQLHGRQKVRARRSLRQALNQAA